MSQSVQTCKRDRYPNKTDEMSLLILNASSISNLFFLVQEKKNLLMVNILRLCVAYVQNLAKLARCTGSCFMTVPTLGYPYQVTEHSMHPL